MTTLAHALTQETERGAADPFDADADARPGETQRLTIMGLDPGPTETAFAYYDGETIDAGITPNVIAVDCFRTESLRHSPSRLAVEMVASYGMPVGREVFETVLWIGRFVEAWEDHINLPYVLLPRLEMKMHLCHDSRARDCNIRQALIDRLGAPGTKKTPGGTYGFRGDMWAAAAVAVTAWDRREELRWENAREWER